MLKVTLIVALTSVVAFVAGAEDQCEAGKSLCSPDGATNAQTPKIGDLDFESLYVDLLQSSLPPPPPPPSKRAATVGTASLCCQSSLSCLTMKTLNLPFCYDKFTTNYYLTDRSFGTLSVGSYTSSTGDTANLISGQYTFENATQGNIYSGNPAAKPDTSTLPVPTQYTASGSGSAIPASALGGEVTLTYTTTLPGSTIPGTTLSATTLTGAVETETLLYPKTITSTVSGYVEQIITVSTSLESSTSPAKTILATTIDATTVKGSVSTVTTTRVGGTSSASTGAVTTSKKSGACGGMKWSPYYLGFVLSAIAIFIVI